LLLAKKLKDGSLRRKSSRVVDRGAQAGAQTVACGEATLSQQENNTRHMSTKEK
jgi:hypothetical protein